ncbi:LacI family DNA-binding transcriptional regulator [Metaclostridioides mangenotii]|uniref:LacI family DNA-binding transcriptional regulator n=1 Tax=Metaclostridioides mangenotii TaxID=1540 RepID=UPI0028EBBE3D|nr:LacI family DNA-binding transcriptional regulator [Clostridioides mangenotii]
MVTIKDIAKNLGISYSTVSRCLNSCPNVSEETKRRVEEEADRLGFHFNVNARNLVKKSTNTIGVVFSNNFNDRDMRRFFSDAMESSIRSIESTKYDFIIQPNNNISGESNIYKLVNGQMVDALLIVSKDLTEKEYEFLNKNDFPHAYMFFKPKYYLEEKNNYFWDDNEYGGYISTQHLIKKSHTKILTITSTDKTSDMYIGRTSGYLKAMEDANLEPHIMENSMDFESQVEFVSRNIEEIKKYSAIFIQQDIPAISINQELKLSHNIRVPDDISIITYNNIELIDYFKSELTTIDDKRETVVKNAADYLVEAINKNPGDKIARVQYPSIIERSSVKAID